MCSQHYTRHFYICQWDVKCCNLTESWVSDSLATSMIFFFALMDFSMWGSTLPPFFFSCDLQSVHVTTSLWPCVESMPFQDHLSWENVLYYTDSRALWELCKLVRYVLFFQRFKGCITTSMCFWWTSWICSKVLAASNKIAQVHMNIFKTLVSCWKTHNTHTSTLTDSHTHKHTGEPKDKCR